MCRGVGSIPFLHTKHGPSLPFGSLEASIPERCSQPVCSRRGFCQEGCDTMTKMSRTEWVAPATDRLSGGMKPWMLRKRGGEVKLEIHDWIPPRLLYRNLGALTPPKRSLAMVQTRHQLNANESSAEVCDAVFGYVLGTCRFGKHQFPRSIQEEPIEPGSNYSNKSHNGSSFLSWFFNQVRNETWRFSTESGMMNGFGKWRICGENVMRSFGLDRQSLQEGGDPWWQFYWSNRIINGDGWIFFQNFQVWGRWILGFFRLEALGWSTFHSVFGLFGSIWYAFNPFGILTLKYPWTDSTSWALMWLLELCRFRRNFCALRNATSSETRMHQGWSWCPTLKPGKCWSRIGVQRPQEEL